MYAEPALAWRELVWGPAHLRAHLPTNGTEERRELRPGGPVGDTSMPAGPATQTTGWITVTGGL